MKNESLIDYAIDAKEKSYSPYSKFKVGSAVLTKEGKVFTGCNIESASYSATICAERVAIFKAVSEGYKNIEKIVVVGDMDYTYPCGVCRQVLAEFGKDVTVIVAKNRDKYKTYGLEELLPYSFSLEENREENEDEF